MSRFEYLSKANDIALWNISLADSKAVAIPTINFAVIGGLYALNIIGDDLEFDTCCSCILTIAQILCFGLLVGGIGFGILVLWPRGESIAKDVQADLFGPESISAKHATPDDYVQATQGLDDDKWSDQLANFVYARSQSNRLKYKRVKFSIVASSLGWFLALFLTGIEMLRP